MFFDDFFFDHYLLYEFTKKELLYMDINGDIPFHMLSFAKDDEEFAEVRRTIVEKKKTLRGIEPRSPERQSRILTIVLQSLNKN